MMVLTVPEFTDTRYHWMDMENTLMTPGFLLKALPFVVDGEADTINSIDLAQVSELLGEKNRR